MVALCWIYFSQCIELRWHHRWLPCCVAPTCLVLLLLENLNQGTHTDAQFGFAKYRLEKGIKAEKRKFSDKLRSHIAANNPTPVWKDLQEITNNKVRRTPFLLNNRQLTKDPNKIYCRFGNAMETLFSSSRFCHHPP